MQVAVVYNTSQRFSFHLPYKYWSKTVLIMYKYYYFFLS